MVDIINFKKCFTFLAWVRLITKYIRGLKCICQSVPILISWVLIAYDRNGGFHVGYYFIWIMKNVLVKG